MFAKITEPARWLAEEETAAARFWTTTPKAASNEPVASNCEYPHIWSAAKPLEQPMRRTLACLLALCLSQPALAEKASGRAMVGEMPVSWGTVSGKMARSAGVEPPLSLTMFTFPPQVAGSAVSEAQWAREAARHGTDVATMKMILGSSVYATKDGRLASCTMFAIKKDLCGQVRSLSLESRAKAAQKILERSGKCRWTGFDPALHERMAQRAGAGSATLWVAADCR